MLRLTLHLCWYDLKTKKKEAFLFFRNIFFITTIAILLGSFSLAIERNYYDLTTNKISVRGISFILSLDKNGEIVEDDTLKYSNKVEKDYKTKNTIYYSRLNLQKVLKKDTLDELCIDQVSLYINKNMYIGEDDYSYDFEYEKNYFQEDNVINSVPFTIEAVSITSPFYASIQQEFSYKYPEQDFLLMGRFLENDNEVVMSAYMLQRFGIYKDYENYLNKEITFMVGDTKILSGYKLVGVINTNFFRVVANTSRSQIWIPGNKEVYAKYDCEYLNKDLDMPSFTETAKLNSQISQYENIDYWITDFITEYEFMEKTRLVIHKIVYIMVLIVIIAMLLKLSISIYTDMLTNASYFGMQRAIGMSKKMLYFFIIGKQSILTILSVFGSIFVSFFSMHMVSKIMREIFFLQLDIGVQDYMKASIFVLVGMIFILYLITYICYFAMFRLEITRNLKLS